MRSHIPKQMMRAIAAATFSCSAVLADPIVVPNAGFEDRDTFDLFPDSTDKYLQWGRESWRQFEISANGGPIRVWNPGAPSRDETGQGVIDVGFGGEAPEGNYVILVRSRENDPAREFEAVTQILAETFDSSKSYTLTAKVGRLPEGDSGGSFNYDPDWFGYRVQFVVGGSNIDGATYAGQVSGGTVLAEDDNSVEVQSNEFVTSTVVYNANPADSIYDGEQIQIRLCALETPENREDDSLVGWVVFDDVSLQTGAFPSAPSFVEITTFDYSAENNTVQFTWNSAEGQTYRVSYSDDLVNWERSLNDTVQADPGSSTTKMFSVGDRAGPNGKIYFRVEKN